MSPAAPQLKAFLLRALAQMGGQPLRESALYAACREAFRGQPLTDLDLAATIRGLEAQGYLAGTHDDFAEQIVWTLTAKGELKAKQLA